MTVNRSRHGLDNLRINSYLFVSQLLAPAWSFRYLVQSTLFNTHKQPNKEDLQAMSKKAPCAWEIHRFSSRCYQLYEDPRRARKYLEVGSYSSKRVSTRERSSCLPEKLSNPHDYLVNKPQLEHQTGRRSTWAGKRVCLRTSYAECL